MRRWWCDGGRRCRGLRWLGGDGCCFVVCYDGVGGEWRFWPFCGGDLSVDGGSGFVDGAVAGSCSCVVDSVDSLWRRSTVADGGQRWWLAGVPAKVNSFSLFFFTSVFIFFFYSLLSGFFDSLFFFVF